MVVLGGVAVSYGRGTPVALALDSQGLEIREGPTRAYRGTSPIRKLALDSQGLEILEGPTRAGALLPPPRGPPRSCLI